MDTDLQGIYDEVMQAVSAEDVFGELIDLDGEKTKMQLLEEAFSRLSATADPKNYGFSPDDAEIARDVMDRLQKFYERAKARIADDVYGCNRRGEGFLLRGRTRFRTERREYFMGDALVTGDLATIYEGECVMGDEFAGKVAIKIINDPADNDLAQNEIRTLKALHAGGGKQRKHLPTLLDNFKTDGGQVGIVLRYLEDCYDFTEVKQKYPKGVPEKHMAWMLNRLLSAIGYAHSMGILHGNIEPTHLMILPRDHNLFILDWSYAITDPVHTGDSFKVFNPGFSAPEIEEKKPPIPSADLYSIGMCMIDILGGDIEGKTMPVTVCEDVQRFLNFMVMTSRLQRAQDAWELHGMLKNLRRKIWGPDKFLQFKM